MALPPGTGPSMSSCRPAVLAAAVALFVVLAGCASVETGERRAAPPASSEPPAGSETATVVLEENFPDPDVLQVGDTYYAYATQPNDGSVNVQMATSTDLMTWELQQQDPLPDLPPWATNGRTWAPEVAEVPDGYVMYFTAHSVDPDLQCIGVARSTSPTGPFRPIGNAPLVCPAAQGGAIDAASFVDEDGERYVLWKNDGNCCGKDTWLYIQPVTPDGLRLTGKPVRLIRQTEPWEGTLVEAPTLLRRNGTYVLLYSANDYSGDAYATGYATSQKLLGPYEKGSQPLMTTETVGVSGPGGQDVVTGPDGEPRILFHGWDGAYVARNMHSAPLTWRNDVPMVSP